MGEFKIIPIREKDMDLIRQWRNSQMDILRQKSPITFEEQQDYFKKVVKPLFSISKPPQLLFSLLRNNVLIGYGGLVHISWHDKRAEMSFLVNPDIVDSNSEYERSMSNFIYLMKKLTFVEMKFNRLYTETYDFRTFHISILIKNGFQQEGLLRQHIYEKGKFHNSFLHSILKQNYVES